MVIKQFEEIDDRIGEFINREFSEYGRQNAVELNYEEYCFVAEGDDGTILGVITGRAYYNEVHIGDLVVASGNRSGGVGSSLVREVENAYSGRGYEKITLTTFGFQAPEFYKKLGYEVEFVRGNNDPKLSKYFLAKALG
ncbi:MAG: GNAT family N-acetyltransferase [Saccharofermentans sp.]|nr:GNAT family N-acetyltransferase [Saccharofermentans sp.]